MTRTVTRHPDIGGRKAVPDDATAADMRIVYEGGYDDGDYGDYGDDAIMAYQHDRDTRVVRIVRGGWVVDTLAHAQSGLSDSRSSFTNRARAFHFARRSSGPVENPDWRGLAASAKDKAKRAHEWSKPHAAKAWEATKSGARRAGAAAKRGAKKAAPHVARGVRSVSERLDRWAVENPRKRRKGKR